MKEIWTVARRELKTLLDQPTGYILLVVFVTFTDFMLFKQAYYIGEASLRPMLELLPWTLLILAPAVTMRALAEEVRSGTIEVSLAQPVTELQWLVGKFIGLLLFVWLGLALTLPIPIGLSLGADIYVGVIISQYVGAAFLAAAFVAVGVWTSSLTHNQITAFILGVAAIFVLIFLGLNPVLVGLPPALNAVAARLGVLTHFANIARGVIDLRDAVYFFTVSAAFLTLAYTGIMTRRLSPTSDGLKRLRTATVLIVTGLVVINLFGRHIRGRLDLTPGNAFTLSDATHDILGELDDIVNITLFASKEFPPEIITLKRDLEDFLYDFRGAGGGMVRVVEKDPSQDETVLEEAQSLGIPPIQFNVTRESEYTVREGYLGLAIQYADETETIPFVQRTEDLEYRLASFLKSMTDESQKKVGLFVGQGSPAFPRSVNQFRQVLGQTYDVRTVLTPGTDQPSGEVDVMVFIGSPDSLNQDQVTGLTGLLARGGGVLVLDEGMMLPQDQQQGQFAFPRPVVVNPLLELYGVKINSDMVFDHRSNEQIQLPTNFGTMIQPYPLWLQAMSTRNGSIAAEIGTVFMPWASSIDTSGAVEGTVIPLLVTSEAAGADSALAVLNPQRRFPRENLHTRLMAAAVNPLAVDEPGELTGRMVVVGTADVLHDNFLQRSPDNVNFVLNAVDWLAQDEALASIRAKIRTPPVLVFSSDGKQSFVQWANVVGVPMLLILFAIGRMGNRRRLTRMKYERRTGAEV